MLNYQRLIIGFLLFAAIWMQTLQVETLEDVERKKIIDMERYLVRVQENPDLIPEGGINHFNSWHGWQNIPEKDKVSILYQYETYALEIEETVTGKDLHNERAECAYDALNEYIEEKYCEIQVLFGDKGIMSGIKKVKDGGNFLDYLACYYRDLNDPRTKEQANIFKETIHDEKTRIMYTILVKYLKSKGYGVSTSK